MPREQQPYEEQISLFLQRLASARLLKLDFDESDPFDSVETVRTILHQFFEGKEELEAEEKKTYCENLLGELKAYVTVTYQESRFIELSEAFIEGVLTGISSKRRTITSPNQIR